MFPRAPEADQTLPIWTETDWGARFLEVASHSALDSKLLSLTHRRKVKPSAGLIDRTCRIDGLSSKSYRRTYYIAASRIDGRRAAYVAADQSLPIWTETDWGAKFLDVASHSELDSKLLSLTHRRKVKAPPPLGSP